MSPLAYDPKATVGGAPAALTVGGIAVGLIAGLLSLTYGLVAGGVGLVLALAFRAVRRPSLQIIARLGLGLVVGAVLAWLLTELGVLPQGLLGRR